MVNAATVASAVIAGTACAFPRQMDQDTLWTDVFGPRLGHSVVAERLFRAAGVERRHAVVDPLVEDASPWSTGERMRRYVDEAAPLGRDAVSAALADAGVSAADIGLFAVVSCTGYATPGLDITLSADLGMPATVQRLMIGHMGCYAAIPGLGAVADFVVARGRPAVLLCLELTSLHAQPLTDDLAQVVTHALFADAAAAIVVCPADTPSRRHSDEPADLPVSGMNVIDVSARTDHSTADHMRWNITDHGFRMDLSPQVPAVLARHLHPAITDLLERHELSIPDIGTWIVHPGGPRILDAAQKALDLTPEQLEASRHVLRERGNCSSATVLIILDQLRRSGQLSAGKPTVMTAFGPGLTLYTALLSPTATAHCAAYTS